jgi:CHAD domain-containing protein
VSDVEIACLLDDVEKGIRDAIKTVKYQVDLEFFSERYSINLEAWAEDLKRAQMLLGVNL